jgi:hypothetical protein
MPGEPFWVVFAATLVTLAGCRESKQEGVAEPGPAVSRPAGGAVCPQKFSELLPAESGEQSCVCPAQKTAGKVWGSGIYTGDSSLCSAAVHAGAIGTDGGKVSVRAAAGCPVYLGSTNNQVSTSPSDASARSYFFPSVSDGKCGPDAESAE